MKTRLLLGLLFLVATLTIQAQKTNQIWCSYIASTAGTLKFNANIDQDFIQMVIFKF